MTSTLSRTVFTAVLIASFALVGCASGSGSGDSSAPADDPYAGDGTAEQTGAAGLMVADSTLGEIVVDGEGLTVYMFDSDTQGGDASTCEGQCAANWPAVPGDATTEVDGVTGEVGSITGVDGEAQLTLNGWPLYYYAGDSAAGDVNGQGVNDVWWVLSPDGERMTG